jgi:hypothetical protein
VATLWQHCGNIVATLYQNYIWQKYGESVAKLWQNYGKIIIKLLAKLLTALKLYTVDCLLIIFI